MLQAVLGAAAVLAAVYSAGFVGREGTPWVGSWVKAGSVALLVVGGAMMGVPGWVVAGLALGAAGDFALSRPGERAFLAGMAAFAAGHLAYGVQFGGRVEFSLGGGQAAALVVLALLILSSEVWLAPYTGSLRWPVRAYVGVIGGMAGTAVLLPAAGLLWVGVALFVVSDFLLALQKFRVKAAVLSHLVWPAYWLGQALIVVGAAVFWSPKA